MKSNRNKQFITKNKDWKYIKRYNEVTRGISKNAQDILFAGLYQINKYGHAVLTHYELSKITDTERHQNCRLVKQLGFVFDITFERSIIISNKKYRDCYIFTKNENTDKILANPVEYFANLLPKTVSPTEQKCSDKGAKMFRSSEPLYIYNKKERKINDNHDYQHNQFQDSINFSSEDVETLESKIATAEIDKNSEKGLAREESQVISECNTETVETIGKDGNTYKAPYLRDFRFTDRMLQTAISRSNKPHYTPNRVWVIIRNILVKKPDRTIYGGRRGAINYLVKAIDGENDYEYASKRPPTQEGVAISMAEIQIEKQRVVDERYQLLLQGKIKSISQAENYYG